MTETTGLAVECDKRLGAASADPVADRLIEFRFENIHRHVPALHATAQLNLAICVFVMWREGVTPLAYAWTPLLTLFSIWRVLEWGRFRRSTRQPENAAMPAEAVSPAK